MIFYYDLHIHSILSPDADVLMTPNNIFNMAYLKKLDIIAVTDHNSAKQLKICDEISQSYDILFIPGIELSLKEDIHVLCYFENVKDAIACDELLEPWRSKKRYDGRLGSDQGITDIHDEVIDFYPHDLSENLSLSLLELKEIIQSFRHILVFAHVDRKKHSGLRYIDTFSCDAVEITQKAKDDFIRENHLESHIILHSSDAHFITDMNECTDQNKLELESLTTEAFFKYFHHG